MSSNIETILTTKATAELEESVLRDLAVTDKSIAGLIDGGLLHETDKSQELRPKPSDPKAQGADGTPTE